MTRLILQETPTGWIVHVHPSDRMDLDQNHSYPTKREALVNTRRILQEWIDEVDDC